METDIAARNAAWGAAIIGGLVAAGVRRVVISPGSRSTPLTLAALRAPDVTAEVILDERSAGFYALGLARAEGMPAVLICTSGSAVANWHPAVIEADAAGVPLILLSADRPPELLACGANQAIDQSGLFGRALRAFHALPPAEEDTAWLANLMAQCVCESRWPLPGPVQVNVALREPLLGAETPAVVPATAGPDLVLPRAMPDDAALDRLARRIEGRKGVIVCGAEPMPAGAVAALAAALDVPVLADPLSGMRFGPHDRDRVIAGYDLFLRRSDLRPDYVLRFGAPPVSKPLAQWPGAKGAEHWAVMRPGRWSDPARDAAVVAVGDFDAVALGLAQRVRQAADPSWTASFLAAEAEARAAVRRLGGTEAAAIATMIATLPEGALLFLGNSMAIRDFDAFSGTAAKALTVMGNRGASGIDGNLSTFFGAAASGRFPAAAALVGDLTFLHDGNGLAAGKGDGVVCVLSNGGGAIFDHLAPAALLPAEDYQRGWLTPQGADVGGVARAFGCAHAAVRGESFKTAFAEALARPGRSVVELAIDRAASRERHRALWDAMIHSVEMPQ